MQSAARALFSLAVGLAALAANAAVEDAGSGTPDFKQGDTIAFDKVEKLKPFLPKDFWDNRDFFFYEGMKLEIGPTNADYSPSVEYVAATQKNKGVAKIGPENSLEGHKGGQPFLSDEIDCKGDPKAGAKIMWNHKYQWNGFGGAEANFYYSYWDRGEELPLYYQGVGQFIWLSRHVENQYAKTDGDVFRGEKRTSAEGVQVDQPFDARGIALMTYRYKASDGPKATTKNDDTWVYVPTLRRTRRISTAQRTDAVAGTDFTLDDLFSFNGIVPQYEWTCVGEGKFLAPMNTKVKAYPYAKDHNFGPYGLSYADDRWELRDSWVVEMDPRNEDHPYSKKILYIDKQTYTSHYSFAFDTKNELWKILIHNKRWSEDTSLTGDWYTGWDGIANARDLVIVSDTIVNVQTGTGNRIEFWDRSGMPIGAKPTNDSNKISTGKIRRYIDVGRLTKGR
jgi:hypothetical protein